MTTTLERKTRTLDIIKEIALASEVPVIGAGNIGRVENVKKLLYAGCSKAILNFKKDNNISATDITDGLASELYEILSADKKYNQFNNDDKYLKGTKATYQVNKDNSLTLLTKEIPGNDIYLTIDLYIILIDYLILHRILPYQLFY